MKNFATEGRSSGLSRSEESERPKVVTAQALKQPKLRLRDKRDLLKKQHKESMEALRLNRVRSSI